MVHLIPLYPDIIPWKIYVFLPQSVDPIQPVKYNLVARLLLLTLPSPPRSIQVPSFLV